MKWIAWVSGFALIASLGGCATCPEGTDGLEQDRGEPVVRQARGAPKVRQASSGPKVRQAPSGPKVRQKKDRPDRPDSLPVAFHTVVQDNSEFHTYFGVPECDEVDLVLTNIGYMAGYSEDMEIPLWVSYQLFRVGNESSFPRLSRFLRDDRTTARTVHDDYTNSGYDRGHMAPSSGIGKRWGRRTKRTG